MWVNGNLIANCSTGLGSAQALTDGVDATGGVYVEAEGCTGSSAGFNTW
jgi:hypothetical protein